MMLLKLAFRNILRQKRRSILTGLSMAGGYLLCVVSVSLTEGSYNNLINLFTLDHTGHIQIHKNDYLDRPKSHKAIRNSKQLSELLDAHPKILAHSLRIYTPSLAYADQGNTPARIIGIDLIREQTTSRLKEKITAGQYIEGGPDDEGYYSAMIGAGIASALKIGLGDEIILISQGADGSIANDIFKVGAIVGKKDSLDKLNIFLPLEAAQTFISLYGGVHEVSILLNNGGLAREVAADLQAGLKTDFPELVVAPWQVVEETFFKSMQADKQGNRFVLGVIVFIVFIGVLNTVLMSVLERTREFGVLRAIGSRPLRIVALISLETSMLAMFSILVGFLIAAPLILWFSSVGIELSQPVDIGGIAFSHMRGEFSGPVFIGPMLTILIFAFLISIPPGIRAASVSPTAAMGSH